MSQVQTTVSDLGQPLFEWTAHDYHPHQRGIVWKIIFWTIFIGGAALFVYSDPGFGGWFGALTFLAVGIFYDWTHNKGLADQQIQVYEKGMVVDETAFFLWEEIAGYWFNYDETVSTINFDFNNQKKGKITFQMGQYIPVQFRESLSETQDLVELEDRKESTLELWVRALKL